MNHDKISEQSLDRYHSQENHGCPETLSVIKPRGFSICRSLGGTHRTQTSRIDVLQTMEQDCWHPIPEFIPPHNSKNKVIVSLWSAAIKKYYVELVLIILSTIGQQLLLKIHSHHSLQLIHISPAVHPGNHGFRFWRSLGGANRAGNLWVSARYDTGTCLGNVGNSERDILR